eukprot:TRINITY_DN3542_c0_g1_i1.p1 TRINITY_DN3542_c0_g1~~TRINITY_DN3542_c0_g1_i1.p1  ORF type:complete len:324 (+),score=45.20 TRINITY_DN3542_c0_g1_i1:45-974(+)
MGNVVPSKELPRGSFGHNGRQSRDGTTYYQLTGPPEGTPVILVHGMMWWSFCFDSVVEMLVEAGYLVLTFDLRGRGNSLPTSESYSEHMYASQLQEISQEVFGQRQFHLLGYSLGGGIAATFATKCPESLLSLFLVAPAGCGNDKGIGGRLSHFSVLSSAITPLVAALAKSTLLANLEKERFADDFYDPHLINDELRGEWAKRVSLMIEGKEGYMNAFASTLASTDLTTQYLKWNVPDHLSVVVIWGTEDKYCPYVYHQNLLSAIPQAKLVTFEGVGHTPFLEKPLLFHSTLVKSLQETREGLTEQSRA